MRIQSVDILLSWRRSHLRGWDGRTLLGSVLDIQSPSNQHHSGKYYCQHSGDQLVDLVHCASPNSADIAPIRTLPGELSSVQLTEDEATALARHRAPIHLVVSLNPRAEDDWWREKYTIAASRLKTTDSDFLDALEVYKSFTAGKVKADPAAAGNDGAPRGGGGLGDTFFFSRIDCEIGHSGSDATKL